MKNSLSLILPVHNAESWLARQISPVLELLSELTSQFEILIVDDASTDHTLHVADDLAAEYPQLRVLRHAKRQGFAAAAQSGTRKAKHETIIIQEDRNLSGAEVRRLWQLQREEAITISRLLPHPPALDAAVIERLSAWGQSLQANQPAAAMTADESQSSHREVVLQLQPTGAAHVAVAESRPAGEGKRSDVPHAARQASPMRSFLKHLRELSPGQ